MNYTVAGLSLVSDFRLTAIPLDREEGGCGRPVSIRRGKVPLELAGDAHFAGLWQIAGDQALLTIGDFVRILVLGDDEVLVDARDTTTDAELEFTLLGSVLALICMRRAILPLHAATVALDGKVAAFAGISGAGKSTLATALAQQGHAVFADDLSLVTRGGDGPFLAWPGARRVRLWGDSLAGNRMDPADARLEWPPGKAPLQRWNKFVAPLPTDAAVLSPLPLRSLYILEAGDGPVRFEPIHGARRCETLLRHVYGLRVAGADDRLATTFALCRDLLGQISVHRLIRPLGYSQLPGMIAAWQAHFLAEAA